MLASKYTLIEELKLVMATVEPQGVDLSDLKDDFPSENSSYDEIAEFAERLSKAPLKKDWPYVEPNDLDEIWAECDPNRPLGKLGNLTADEEREKAEAAFYGAVAGCILGKPLEINPTLADIRKAAEAVGEWPINDYISNDLMEQLGRNHGSSSTTTRGHIDYVTLDDDLNYTTLGMVVLETHGIDFTKEDLDNLWVANLQPGITFGPERRHMVKLVLDGFHSRERKKEGRHKDMTDIWPTIWNGNDEYCGAQIRADAYGYACAGRPALAADMAWRDASRTHRRTGIYSTMFTAAAIAAAFTATDRLEPFEIGLQFVPKKSRFYERTADCLEMVRESSDWLEAYEKINKKYGAWGHCRVYQETGMMINSMKFAENTGDGFCKQVSQGADTDCYCEIIGSLLGAYLGPDGLEDRWISVFNDDFRVGLAWFFERSLKKVAEQMGGLPALVESQLSAKAE